MYARAASSVCTPRSVTLRTKAGSLSCATMNSASASVSSRRRRRSVSSTRPRLSGGDEKLANVLGGAAAARVERVPAFERGDDAALRMPAGDSDELARHPRIVVFDELEARQRIFAVRIEAGRDVNQLWTMLIQRRQPVVAHRGAERVAAATRRER